MIASEAAKPGLLDASLVCCASNWASAAVRRARKVTSVLYREALSDQQLKECCVDSEDKMGNNQKDCKGCYPAIALLPTPPRETLMIGSEPENRDELRTRVREMSDLELRRFGRRARDLSNPQNNFGATEPYVIELDEARAEWRRRYPVQDAPGRSRISNLVAR
jgi:hypothetical protein